MELAKEASNTRSREVRQFPSRRETVEAASADAHHDSGRLIIRAIFGQRGLALSPLQTTKRR
jgi:hypothetical protein